MIRRLLIRLLPVLLLTGCARYEFDLVQPPDLARHIGSQSDETLRIDPLEYRLRAVENRLVLRIFNPTNDPVTLAGDKSYVIDPAGQSHPIRGQTIAPSTFIRLILPPMRPYYYNSGPTIGIGLGFGYSRARFGHPFYDPFPYDEPRYYTYYDESDSSYWNWDGETDARLHLVYQEASKTLTHDFTFHRKKM